MVCTRYNSGIYRDQVYLDTWYMSGIYQVSDIGYACIAFRLCSGCHRRRSSWRLPQSLRTRLLAGPLGRVAVAVAEKRASERSSVGEKNTASTSVLCTKTGSVSTHANAHTHTRTHTHAHTLTHTRTRAHTHTQTHTRTRARARTHTHTQ